LYIFRKFIFYAQITMCNLELGLVRSHEETNHTRRKRMCMPLT